MIPLKSLQITSMGEFGSSIIIFGVIWSLPGAFFGFSSPMTFAISFGWNNGGREINSDPICGGTNEPVAGFGWKTFLRCKAKVSALSLSLWTQLPDEFLIRVTVSIGELRFGWALHRGCFVLVAGSFLMYRSCAFSVSCLRARFSVRVASLRRCFDDGDLLVCQARRRRLFSRTVAIGVEWERRYR